MVSSLNDKKFSSMVEHNKTSTENELTVPFGQIGAGQYNSSAPTLANGDYGFFQLTADGSLKTTATISGDVNVDNTSLSTDGYVGKASGTNADFTTAYASGTTITLSSLPSGVTAITADDIVSIQQIATDGSVTNTYTRDDITLTAAGTDPTTLTVTGATFVNTDTFVVTTNIQRETEIQGDTAHDAADANNPLKFGGRARTTQITAVANNDRTDSIFNVYGEQVIAGYTWATQSLRTEEIDPISQQFVTETLANVTDATDGTFNYYFDMNGFRYFTLQIALTQDAGAGAGDVYCYATVQDDGTAPGSCTYQDVTNDLFGVSSVHTQHAATQVLSASDMWVADTPNGFKYVNIRVITTTGNTSDWTIFLKKFYQEDKK